MELELHPNNPVYNLALGYLESAAYLAYKHGDAHLAKNLLQTECIDSGKFTLEQLKLAIEHEESSFGIIWREFEKV